MKEFPEDEDDQQELARLNAEPWMAEQLKLNPSYVYWGPGDDYMKGVRADGGWDSAIIVPNWAALVGPRSADDPGFQLNDLNEVVHFYFRVTRDAKNCDTCEQTGYNPATKQLAEAFYTQREDAGLDMAELSRRLMLGQDVVNALGREVPGWQHALTDEEVEFLRHEQRLFEETSKTGPLTTAQVNADYHHDAINHALLVRHRAQRLGIYGQCDQCAGRGYIFTAPAARLELVLWLLQPRKGASHGLTVENITQEDLPAVYAFLKAAAQRNAERFSKIP